MKTGIELIAEERQRQIEVEGWTEEHDDRHSQSELAIAGGCYALAYADRQSDMYLERAVNQFWPWDNKWWKPTPDDPVRQLVKAGALIAAEIDRLQRHKEG